MLISWQFFIIENHFEFLNALKKGDSLQSRFQLKQMVTGKGEPLQTTLIKKNFRFLNEQEISALNNVSEQYRAYRYLTLREQGFPRLLTREEFPFDEKHKENEKLFNFEEKDEEFFYDPSRQEFTGREFEFDSPGIPLKEGSSGSNVLQNE